MNEEQLIELQTQLAFHEHTIAELNEALTQHQRQLDRFRLEVQLLQEKFGALEDMVATAPHSARDEKPPHY